jgi:hypothetical protein
MVVEFAFIDSHYHVSFIFSFPHVYLCIVSFLDQRFPHPLYHHQVSATAVTRYVVDFAERVNVMCLMLLL